ncbi:hypothetical protein BASA50_003588 [Batrachochytrium salamandrivorans]|uniref:Poly(A)-specific ribonuclease RNA-binding domain-containing protein n=1 Tax=Batrachochytrium salamandrivorans TaxID=1357716 RepID=A0ABQ8FHV6_9FUNG|nr:hypothetical protein BASA62_009916 [Batrachochytrium salamandrivorans]KAH6569845.1 hypothetical protein BASA60_008041 [Batrachochytrium salamandrivorans]KAH6598549.1 hypothetical protein BASA50_003588 [Batrachochytrium salamandrivorans]KAH6602084.1 hypothetical protein BASA61_001453 [Batrachochytrium salamandrivorans]KAH9266584.1 hypothetical protein BASA84_001072 [Batrachochytrium salamandrivorans]
MEVVRSNFEETLDAVREAVEGADFICLDTELTGLGITPNERIDLLDTPQERYTKRRSSAMLFNPTQVGLATFCWNAEGKAYIVKSFNFNIFPRAGNKFFGLDRTFASQSSSLEFLNNNGFDFNKWVAEGIPFVSSVEEKAIRTKLEEIEVEADIVIDDRHKKYIEDSMEGVRNWLKDSTDEVYSVPTPSSYHKRLIHQETKKEFAGQVTTESSKLGVIIKRLQNEELASKPVETRRMTLEAELDKLIGFRKVIDILTASQKPIVGHNMSIDLCHLIHQFVQPLPESWVEYKAVVARSFPSVYDSKFVANSNPKLKTSISSSVLGELFSTVSQAPFNSPAINFAPGFEGYEGETPAFHRAGFDAYITGVSFLRMIYLATSLGADSPLDWTNDLVEHCNNKLYLMYSDMSFLDLNGKDSIPDRTNVFYLSDFPPSWKTSDIISRFKDIGFITVKWINETSCLIIVRDRKMVLMAERLCGKKNRGYQMCTWTGSYESPTSTQVLKVDNPPVVDVPEISSTPSVSKPNVSPDEFEDSTDTAIAQGSKRGEKRRWSAETRGALRETVGRARKTKRTSKASDPKPNCAIM